MDRQAIYPAIGNIPEQFEDAETIKFLTDLKRSLEIILGNRGDSYKAVTQNDLRKIGIDPNALNTDNPSYNFESMTVLGMANPKKHFSATKSNWAPGTVTNGSSAETTLTVTGARVGDVCCAGYAGLDEAGWDISCYISAPDTARFRITNKSGGDIAVPANELLRVSVWRY